MDLTRDRVLEVLDYNPRTGDLSWGRDRPGQFRRGQPACRRDRYGYLNVSIDGQSYKAHRIVWLIERGEWPPAQIDHANGQRSDNRIGNLREATYQENGQNRALQRNSRSGYTGVSWYAPRQKWRAQIAKDGRRYALGCFDTPEQARDAYLEAKAKLHEFQPKPRSMGRKMG